MTFFSTTGGSPLGNGVQYPAGCIQDLDLKKRLASFKRSVASRYRAVVGGELSELPPGQLWVSPKVDGACWYLIIEGDEAWLANPTGRVLGGALPLLDEARQLVAPRATGRTIIAGELFALKKGSRPRVSNLAKALGGGAAANVKVLGFMAFELLEGGDSVLPQGSADYADRLAVLQRLFANGRRVQLVPTEILKSQAEVQARYDALVVTGKAEGLICRTRDNRIYKVKPSHTVDAVVIGYTERAEDRTMLSSMLLALVREDGHFQLLGSCGNMKGDDNRRSMLKKLQPLEADSDWRRANRKGALYRFVRPEVVVEIKLTDLQSEDANGRPVQRMVVEWLNGKWRAVRKMPFVSILFPVFVRVRDDKQVNAVDCRVAQVEDRAFVEDLHTETQTVTLPTAEIVRREVYTKESKGKTAVRKLLVWRTHKEKVDTTYPAYVVHWTDYSSTRKDPLKRVVRIAPSATLANEIAESLVAKGVKRGWHRVS